MKQSLTFAALVLAAVLGPVLPARSSLTEYDATITADTVAGPPPTARLLNAVTFNGASSFPFNFGAVSGAGTFECIVEGSPVGVDGYLAVGSNAASNLRFEQYNNTGQAGFTQLGVADYLFQPGVPTPASPAHLTYAWNGAGTMKLYVNGALAGTQTGATTAFGLPSGSGRLGASPSNGEGMTGTIYRVTCYDDVLADAAIQRHADAWLGIQRPPVISSFTSSPSFVQSGAQVTLSWQTSGATALTLDGTDVTGLSQAARTLTGSTAFTLTAINPNGSTASSLTVPVVQAAGHVVINEFMAENKSVLADEDGEHSDWLELYNPTAAAVDLSGWHLTDDAAIPEKWALPAATLAAGGYRIVFLSGKDRAPAAGQWHTSFRLGKDGEYLALHGPGGIVQEFAPAFPPQDEDVSYGITGGDPSVAGFMGQPTPGTANNYTLPLPARVEFSQKSGVIAGPVGVALSCATPDAELHYRLNNSQTAVTYTAPVEVSATTQITAWSVRNGQRSADVRVSFVRLSPQMAAYSSPLPVMIMENFAGGPIPQKGWSGTGAGVQQVPQQPAAWLAWDRAAGGASSPSQGPPQFFSQTGVRGRGAFSSSWRQKPYAVECWNEAGGESEAGVLGMPAHADWVLYFPDPDDNKDPTLLFNTFVYEMSARCGRYAPRFRWVELFVNEDGGDVTLTDRRGVYAVLEKVSRGTDRLDFAPLSENGSSGGWLVNINRMDAVPEGGWPAENGAATPQFFRTAGPNRMQQTVPNNPAVVGDDLPQQSNAYINFDNPGGYHITAPQRAAVEGWFKQFEDVLYNNTLWRDPVNGYRKHLDDRDFAEYFIFNVLSRNGDGMLISMFPWKGDDGRLRMGPTWDYNWSSYYVGGGATGDLQWRSGNLWYTRLFTDPDFRQIYIDRWFAFRRGALTNAGIDAVIDGQAAEITSAKAVAQGIADAATWQTRLTTMKNWLKQRANWMDGSYLRPPVFGVPSGPVAGGAVVSITAPAGTVQRTLDGTDPRLSGGTISPAATASGSIAINADTRVMARAYSSTVWSAPTSAIYIPDASAPSAANLVVSEIHYHPAEATPAETAAGFTDRDDFEFVELLNISAQKTSLAGVQFVKDAAGKGIVFDFNEGGIWSLPPGGRLVVVKRRAAFAQRYGASIPVAGEYTGRLSNSGESLTLRFAAGGAARSIPWGDAAPWPEAADGGDYSLTLILPEANPDPAQPLNWRSSSAAGGSPGASDGIPWTGGDPVAYAVGANAPQIEFDPAADEMIVRIQRVPGSDAVLLAPELSTDLSQWTAAAFTFAGEIRLDGGEVMLAWRAPAAARQFVRVRGTVR